jgi:hypothetical protein
MPLDGYYNYGTYQLAFPCDSKCLTCNASGNNSCFSCHPNTILVGKSCLTCTEAVSIGCTNCSKNGSKPQCTSCEKGTL